jgi:hypothetical protein
MRTVVIGGFGNFGARICRALAADPNIHVVAAGRNPDTGPCDLKVDRARIDLGRPDFSTDLKKLSPDLVIHCAGPFQGQDYRVPEAAVSAGAHYVDLADGRGFVARFAGRFDANARETGLFMTSGASTVPALSSAVIDGLRGRFRFVDEIQIAIAPGQRAPRGNATIAGVFSYAGKSFRWMKDGAWRDVCGWQDLVRIRFAGLGVRWAAACDVPDLELFPSRYPGVQTVEFHAALELGVQHAALWLAAALRRAGLPLPIERAAPVLNIVASHLDRFGSDKGGMLVRLTGSLVDGARGQVEWHLTAAENHGPEIPCMSAILLARKLARGEISARGAYPCMGFLSLQEFAPLFAQWGISSAIEEKAA